jgi:hypothetical protein
MSHGILFYCISHNVGMTAQHDFTQAPPPATRGCDELQKHGPECGNRGMAEHRNGHCRTASRNKLKEISIYFQENPKVWLKRSVT